MIKRAQTLEEDQREKKKQEASRNLRDVSRVDFTLFENYRRERLKFLNKKARKSKNSPSRQTTKSASPSVEKQKDRLIAPKPNVNQLVVHPQGVIPQHFAYASYPTPILPLQVYQNKQTVPQKDSAVVKKPVNRKRPAPIDSDSDCDENYGIILSGSKDSTFFMHNYACNPSKQISQSLPKHFLLNHQKAAPPSPPDVLINEHDILSAIALDDPLSKVNISTFPNLNSRNIDLNSGDLKNFISKGSYIGCGFNGGSALKQNLLDTSPLLRGGSCAPIAIPPKSGMPDTELSSFTCAAKNKLDGVDLLKEFDVVSKIMLEMDAEFNSAHSKVSPPEHELSQSKTVQQPTPIVPNITLPKGVTLTLVEPTPPKGDMNTNKQGDKEAKTVTDNTVKLIPCQPKVSAKNEFLLLEKTVQDVVRNMVDEVSRKMYIASLSRTGSKLNHLQAGRSVKRLCARCKCLLVQDSMNRYSCKNCKSLVRISPKKSESGPRDVLRNCDKAKSVSAKQKTEKVSSTPNKLWKTLSKYDQNRLSYLKHSLNQNKKNVKIMALNNSPKKPAFVSPLMKEKLEKANNKFSVKRSNSLVHKLNRKNSSGLVQKVVCKQIESKDDVKKDGTCVRNEAFVKSDVPTKSENDLKVDKDSALKTNESSPKKQNSMSGDESELDKEKTSHSGETTSKKGGVEVKNINRGLFLMTFGEPDAEIDMSAGNNDPVDKENTLASSKRTESSEKEKSTEEPEKEKTNNTPLEKGESETPSDNGATHPLIQKQGINEISCTYVIPQVPSIIVAKYSSDNSQNGDFLLSSVAHIQQNPPNASLNVVKTSSVTSISGVPQNELLNKLGQACDSLESGIVPDVNTDQPHKDSDKINCGGESMNSASTSNGVCNSGPTDSIVSEKENTLSPGTESVIEAQSPSAAKSAQSIVPNESAALAENDNSNTGAVSIPAEGNQSDSSLFAAMKETLDVRRRNISHELDAVAILSILDLDGSRSRSETLLRSLLDKEFKELKEIRGMKISDLDAQVKNLIAMKMNRILDTIKSLQLATMLFRQYETLDKVVEAVLRKPSSVKENAPPSLPNNVCAPANEKILAKLEGRQDCRFASCSVTSNVQLETRNIANALTNPSVSNESENRQLESALNPKMQCKTEASAASSCCMQSGGSATAAAGSAAANYLERIEKQVSSIAPQAANASQLPAMLQGYRQFPGGILQNSTNPNIARSMIVQQTPSPIQQMQPSQSPTQRMPSPMQAAQSPIQRMQSPMQPVQSPMQPVQSPMQPVQSPLQQVTSPVHPAPSPMHPPQSPMQQNHPLSLPSAEEMHRTPSNGSGSRPGSGRPHSTESVAMPLSPASIKKEALSAPSLCSGTVPGPPSESASSVTDQYSASLGGSMQVQANPFPDDVVYSNGMLIHRQAPPPTYSSSAPVRSIGPPNRTVPFASQLPFSSMGNNRFGGGYNPMQTVHNPAVGLPNQVALYNQQMTNSGVRVQQVVLPNSNSNLQQLNKPYTPDQVSTVQGNGYTLQTQSTASIVPSTNAMTASTQVVPVQNSLRLAQGSQGTNASSYQTVSQVAPATAQVMQQPNWNKPFMVPRQFWS